LLVLIFQTKKWNDSGVLFKRTLNHIEDALSHHKECLNADEALVSKLQLYKTKAEGKESHALVQKQYTQSLPQPPQQKQVAQQKQEPVGLLINHLNSFSDNFVRNKSFVDFPPNFEPVPCKPVLYDMAFSLVSYPDLTAKKKAPAVGSRLFGSWWG